MSDISDSDFVATREELLQRLASLRAEVASLKEQNALLTVQVQEGWKLVPVEPTADMIIAAGDGYEAGEVIGPASCYRVMIAAAPALTQSEDARDAARYRYLRDQPDGKEYRVIPWDCDRDSTTYGDDLDAAIDADIRIIQSATQPDREAN